MKQISRILGIMEASLNGSLDGLQLDNTDDVIEKSLVIEMVNDLKMLVNEAQTEVKNISSKPMLADSFVGRDEDDSLAISEAKTLWNDKKKLDAVKRLMRDGWGLKVAHDYCQQNFG